MMERRFKVEFLDEAVEFLDSLDEKAREKVIYNVYKAQFAQDKDLFKKLTEDIWEFRTMFNKTHYRLFAFWDRVEEVEKLIIATHGIIKKTKKTPPKEIKKAVQIKEVYFKIKSARNEKQ
ncbi:MAG TPA: type II toxin-antitoxin system RelE/ParE family toxin [Prolixibacteraceae bacterium]|nr:type II toxin-antitoxin system RelE/ParE family toxin [Prolixibacteraceae bacterium]